MKAVARRNVCIIIVFILYCIFVWFFSSQIRDVEIMVSTSESTNDGTVVQIFWNAGEGYNAENSLQLEIMDAQGSMIISQEIVEGIISCRWDPTNVQRDIVYTSIWINGNKVELSEFASWIESTEQCTVQIKKEGNSTELNIMVYGNDPQFFMGQGFTENIRKATSLPTQTKGLLTLIGLVGTAIGIFFKEIVKGIRWCLKRIEEKFGNVARSHPVCLTICCILLLAIMVIFVMNQYLFGTKRFLFIDAADSYYQTYPNLLNTARNIEKGLIYGGFNFCKGLGSGLGIIKPTLANWVAYFGTENVAYLMGFSQTIKMLLAGMFFYGFIRVKGKEKWYSVVLALGYVFCGHMSICASWESYPNEVVLLAMWLLCFELWFQRKDFRWLPLATALFFYHFGTGYYLILYLVLLPTYVLFRYVTERKVSKKGCLIAGGIVGVGAIGYLLVTDFSIIQLVYSTMASERVQTTINSTDWSMESFYLDFSLLPRIFGRTVGTSILGIIGNNYVNDYWNFLEDPTFYCGIMVLLLIPLAFSMMNWKMRVWYGLVYAVAVVYCLSEPLRTIINGFSGVTFKLSSFWIIVMMILTVAQIDWSEIREKQKEKRSFIICTVTALLLFWATYQLPTVIDVSQKELNISLCFIVLEYIGISFLLFVKRFKYCIRLLVLMVVCIETTIITYPIYNERLTADGTEYMDDTIKAVEQIKKMEGDSFYRIDKQYVSAQICDSLAQDYYGTAFYVGGTGMGNAMTAFYTDMGLPLFNKNRMAWGTSSYDGVQTILGIKYALSKGDGIANYGYHKIGMVGDVSIYKNEYAMPMGFVYNCAIEQDTFEKLDSKQRQQVLLKACLVENGSSVLPLISDEKLAELDKTEELFRQYEIPFESSENYSFVFEPTAENEMLAVKISFDKTGRGSLCYSTEDGKTNSMLILQEECDTGQIFEIVESGVNRIWSDSSNWAEITDLHIAQIPKSEYYALFEQDIARLKESAVEVTSYTENSIIGNFEAKEDGMLYLPIPSGGWQVFIDGELQNIQTINDAFIGVYVSAGSHTLEVLYPTGTFWSVYGKDIIVLIGCIGIIILGNIWFYAKRRGINNERDINSSTGI